MQIESYIVHYLNKVISSGQPLAVGQVTDSASISYQKENHTFSVWFFFMIRYMPRIGNQVSPPLVKIQKKYKKSAGTHRTYGNFLLHFTVFCIIND